VTTRTLPQPPEFTAAVQDYLAAYRAGVRDLDTLGPIMQRADDVFNWTPRPPVKPLTKRQVDRTVRKWMALPKEQGDRLERMFDAIRDMPEEESTRLLDMWLAVIDLIQQEPAA